MVFGRCVKSHLFVNSATIMLIVCRYLLLAWIVVYRGCRSFMFGTLTYNYVTWVVNSWNAYGITLFLMVSTPIHCEEARCEHQPWGRVSKWNHINIIPTYQTAAWCFHSHYSWQRTLVLEACITNQWNSQNSCPQKHNRNSSHANRWTHNHDKRCMFLVIRLKWRRLVRQGGEKACRDDETACCQLAPPRSFNFSRQQLQKQSKMHITSFYPMAKLSDLQ